MIAGEGSPTTGETASCARLRRDRGPLLDHAVAALDSVILELELGNRSGSACLLPRRSLQTVRHEDPSDLLENLGLVGALVHPHPDALEPVVTQLDHDVGHPCDISQSLLQPCHLVPIIPVPFAAAVAIR